MGRFLIVVPPIVGHIFPTIAVGRELLDRGHEVAWTGHTEGAGDRLPSWARFIPLAEAIPDEVDRAVNDATARAVGSGAGFVGVWRDYVVPVAHQMLPGVLAALDTFAPDAVLVDQQALAGAVAAERRGLRWATSASTSVELLGWLGAHREELAAQFLDPTTIAIFAKMREWLDSVLGKLVVDLGLEPERAASFDPRFSDDLVIAYTTEELLGFAPELPDRFVLVGPSIGDRPDEVPFPWEWLDETKPLVLVSLGTINWRGGGRFFRKVCEAISTMDVQAVLVSSEGVDFEPPPNVAVFGRVPQLALLERVAAVVSHGGHNTVCETLAAGRPLVVAPIRDDQPLIARQVEAAGAGVTTRFNRATVGQLREAITSVLTDERLREGARRLQASFASAGGPRLAADRLEDLLGPPSR